MHACFLLVVLQYDKCAPCTVDVMMGWAFYLSVRRNDHARCDDDHVGRCPQVEHLWRF